MYSVASGIIVLSYWSQLGGQPCFSAARSSRRVARPTDTGNWSRTFATDTGPRQQVVAHLGDLSNFTAADWQALAGRMGESEMAAALQRRVRQGGRQGRPPKWTIEDHSASTSDASDLVSIRLSETSWREPVAFGDVYTALVLWKRLGLGELLSERMDGSAAKVPWPAVAALIAVNRLVEPMPEWPM